MIRRLVILDAALVVLLVLGAVRLRRDWLAFDPAHQVSTIQPKPENLPALPASAVSAAVSSDWTEIPAHNPFSFDRSDIAILAPPPEPPKAVGPKPILFGTMTMGQDWIAMLASGAQANNRNSRPVHIGESVDGWTVVSISDKAVVIEANSARETINLDNTVQVPRAYERTIASASAPTVQSVGSSAPASSSSSTSAAAPSTPSQPSSNTNGRGAAPKMCELQTPFGKVTRPCEDQSR